MRRGGDSIPDLGDIYRLLILRAEKINIVAESLTPFSLPTKSNKIKEKIMGAKRKFNNKRCYKSSLVIGI